MAELIQALLERNARKYPAELAARYPAKDQSLTWQELNAQANSLAHYLQARGLRAGEKVALLIPNRPEFMVGFFAALKAGGVVVPINVRLTASEIEYILKDSGAKALIYDESLREAAEGAMRDLPLPVVVSTRELTELTSRYPGEDLPAAAGLSDPAEIIYTSGTTGRPKGVVLNHRAVYLVASMMAYETQIRFGDRILQLMPLTHSAPLNLQMVGGVYAGAANILGDFTPQTLLELTQAEKTTHFFGAPVAYLLAAKLPNFNQYDLSSAKYWIYGGAPMSREAVLMVAGRFPGRLMSVYGLTESGPNGMALFPEEHPEFAGSIGRRGVVNVEIKVVDEQGQEVGPGGIGEIIMRTPSAMLGYHGNEAATREVLRNGWVWTGDIAKQDEKGYLWIMDRKKDVIISGGVNVYPKEVEDVLSAHPAVADVAVVGQPHPEWGETVMAVIVPRGPEKPSLAELQAFARQRLADYKIPRLIQYTDAIPRNASGKILKNVLREKYGKS